MRNRNKHPLYGLGPVFFKDGSPDIKETDEQKEIAAIAFERYQDYQTNFVPHENRFIEEMVDYDKPSRTQALEGSASNAVESVYSGVIDQQSDAMIDAGVNPNSSAFVDSLDATTRRQAVDTASNVTRTGQAVQDQKVHGMGAVVAMGNGQEADALSGLHDIAQESQQTAINDAFRDRQRTSDNHRAIGAVAGAAGRSAIEYREDE